MRLVILAELQTIDQLWPDLDCGVNIFGLQKKKKLIHTSNGQLVLYGILVANNINPRMFFFHSVLQVSCRHDMM